MLELGHFPPNINSLWETDPSFKLLILKNENNLVKFKE